MWTLRPQLLSTEFPSHPPSYPLPGVFPQLQEERGSLGHVDIWREGEMVTHSIKSPSTTVSPPLGLSAHTLPLWNLSWTPAPVCSTHVFGRRASVSGSLTLPPTQPGASAIPVGTGARVHSGLLTLPVFHTQTGSPHLLLLRRTACRYSHRHHLECHTCVRQHHETQACWYSRDQGPKTTAFSEMEGKSLGIHGKSLGKWQKNIINNIGKTQKWSDSGKEDLRTVTKNKMELYVKEQLRLQKQSFKILLWSKYNIYVKTRQMLLQKEKSNVTYDYQRKNLKILMNKVQRNSKILNISQAIIVYSKNVVVKLCSYNLLH